MSKVNGESCGYTHRCQDNVTQCCSDAEDAAKCRCTAYAGLAGCINCPNGAATEMSVAPCLTTGLNTCLKHIGARCPVRHVHTTCLNRRLITSLNRIGAICHNYIGHN